MLALTKKERKLLESEGWSILSEKPLEIRENIIGGVATKIAAAVVILYLIGQSKTHGKKLNKGL